MSSPFIVQIATTGGIAITSLIAAMMWAKLARPAPPLDETRARFLLQEQFPARHIETVWVGASGMGAIAKSGASALVLCNVGEGYAARQIPWAVALAAGFRDGRICIDLTDVAQPKTVISLPAWSPHDRAA